MSASISGLSSGMDTATIISQLMQLEAVQQNRLKTRVTATTSPGCARAVSAISSARAEPSGGDQ